MSSSSHDFQTARWEDAAAASLALSAGATALLAALSFAGALSMASAVAGVATISVVVIAYAIYQSRAMAARHDAAREETQQWEAEAASLRQALVRLQTEVALHDPETGMSNGRLFDVDFGRLSALGARSGQPFSLAIVRFADAFDLDADLSPRTISMAAGRLTETLRAEDSICRLSRDAFAVLLCNTPLAGADAFVERLGFALSESVKIDGSDRFLTVCGGAAEWRPGVNHLRELVDEAQADLDEYGAMRRRGGKRVVASR